VRLRRTGAKHAHRQLWYVSIPVICSNTHRKAADQALFRDSKQSEDFGFLFRKRFGACVPYHWHTIQAGEKLFPHPTCLALSKSRVAWLLRELNARTKPRGSMRPKAWALSSPWVSSKLKNLKVCGFFAAFVRFLTPDKIVTNFFFQPRTTTGRDVALLFVTGSHVSRQEVDMVRE
jgi:hypothetical protein